jgi:hypothetical protein
MKVLHLRKCYSEWYSEIEQKDKQTLVFMALTYIKHLF